MHRLYTLLEAFLMLVFFVTIQFPTTVRAFNANLVRPWKFKRGHFRIRTRRNDNGQVPSSDKNDLLAVSSPLTKLSSSSSSSSSSTASPENNSATNKEDLSSGSGNDETVAPPQVSHEQQSARITPPLLETNSSLASLQNVTSIVSMQSYTGRVGNDTVWSQLGALTQMTRPNNFPGIFFLHIIGIYIALQSVGRMDLFVTLLLGKPAMWLVLSSVVLVSCTSMVVNDYYDAKLGRDSNMDRPLVRGDLSFCIVRRYLSYLYAAALICGALLPGAPARLAVMLSLMLTYWYTNHLKPLTWVKNAVCAFLIAFAPLASGSAALHLAYDAPVAMPPWLRMGRIGRVVAMLFFGILGREMTMDCNDVENDRAVGVQTIPVVYGPAFASRVALACTGIAASLAVAGPLRDWQQAIVPRAVWARRLGLATTASIIQLTGASRVCQTEGRDQQIVSWAVDTGAKTIMLFLASYL